MSDGITDAKRECKSIRYTSSRINPAPSKCHNCIFITRNPHDNQWECTNPLQHGQCDEPNNCAFHLTLDELSEYTRQRLVNKVKGELNVSDNTSRTMSDQKIISCAECGWHVKQLKFWDDHGHFPYVTWWCSHPNVLQNFNANAPVDRGYCPPRTQPDKIYYNLLKEIPVACTVNCPWCPLIHENGPRVDWV